MQNFLETQSTDVSGDGEGGDLTTVHFVPINFATDPVSDTARQYGPATHESAVAPCKCDEPTNVHLLPDDLNTDPSLESAMQFDDE